MSAELPPVDPANTNNVVPIDAARKRPPAAAPMPSQTGVAQLGGDPLLTNLRQSMLSDDTINAARMFVAPSTQWKTYGFRPTARVQSGLLIPFFAPGASDPHCYRLRPQEPIPVGKRGRLKKYDQPKDTGLLVYTPPLAACLDRLRDTSTPLLWTEGEKKALLLAQLGYCVVGLTGVDAWHDVEAKDRGDGRQLHPYIREYYAIAGRQHVVVFDSDARTNTNVMGAMQRLAGTLEHEGALSVHMCLPPAGGDAKGIDDYARAHGLTACEALLSTLREPIEAAEPDIGCVPLKSLGKVFAGCGVEDSLRMPRGYSAQRDGSIWLDDDPDVEPRPVLDSPMVISRLLENRYTHEQRVEVRFKTPRGLWARVVVPREVLGERTLVTWLRRYGALVNAGGAGAVMRYLDAFERDNGTRIEHAIGVSTFGAHGDDQFVLDSTLCKPGVEAPVQLDADPEVMRIAAAFALSPYATLTGHVEALRLPMAASMECALAVYAALAAPLLRVLHAPNFALHLCGDSSTGKTSMLRIAASVYGDPRNPAWLASWDSTSASQQLRAAILCDLPQLYDEIGANAQHAQDAIYRLIGGTTKQRATREITMRRSATWRTVVVSTGERELANERDATGAQVRVLNIPVTGFGGWDGPAVNIATRACVEQHGALGHSWIAWLVSLDENARDELRAHYQAREAELQAIAKERGDRLGGRVAGFYAALWVAEDYLYRLYGLGCETVLAAFKARDEGAGRTLTADQHLLEVLRDWVSSKPGCFPSTHIRSYEPRDVFGYTLGGGDVGFIQTALRDYLANRGMSLTIALMRDLEAKGILVSEAARHGYTFRLSLPTGRQPVIRLRLGSSGHCDQGENTTVTSESFNESM